MIGSKEIAVLGAARSGVGAAILAKKQGLKVFVSDNNSINQVNKIKLNEHNITWEENGHNLSRILKAKEIIKSPGIPNDSPIVLELLEKQMPIISEIEFAKRYSKGRTICVTGSNGKTTTTLMICRILQDAGLDAISVGNIGESYAYEVSKKDHDYFVIEVSSFQLDNIKDFKSDISILLNITPDHLDRYENNFNKYIQSKFRVTLNQTKEDVLIYNSDDKVIVNELAKRNINQKTYPFSLNQVLGLGAYLDKDEILINTDNKKKPQTIMKIHELALQGKHNIYNSMASAVAAQVLDIRKEIIRDSLSNFQNVEHRLESVTKVHGIEFINDSKATNVNSTWYALECMQRPTIWIVGGVDKGNDYSMLEGLVKQKVIGIICLGQGIDKIKKSFGHITEDIFQAKSASDAVKKSYMMAKKGYSVLLSPACASFDLFKDYEERGSKFKQAVRDL